MGIPLISTLERQNAANFPLVKAEDVLGAFVTVADVTARDAIPTGCLRTGAIVRIGTSSVYYEWNGSAWVSITFGSGSSTVVDWKDSVRAATTANITLSGAQTIDGVSVIAGDRVLVKNQSTGSQNGIYVAATGAWSRSTDADASSEVTSGLTVVVEEGTASAGKIYILTTTGAIVLGTTALTFTVLSSGGSSVTAGNGITDTAGTWSVDAADGTLVVGAPGVKRAPITGDITIADGSNAAVIAANAVTTAKILDANVTTAKIADASVTLAKLSSPTLLDLATVHYATTTNITLSGSQTIDGLSPSNGNLILVWQQTDPTENDFWTYNSAGAWTRATSQLLRPGVPFAVTSGTTHGGKVGFLVTPLPITRGTTPLTFILPQSIENPTAKGQSLFWDGAKFAVAGLKTRTSDLPDTDVTVTVSEGSRFVLSGARTASRACTLSDTGATSRKTVIVEVWSKSAFTYVVKNALGTAIWTCPAGESHIGAFGWDGSWDLLSHSQLSF